MDTEQFWMGYVIGAATVVGLLLVVGDLSADPAVALFLELDGEGLVAGGDRDGPDAECSEASGIE